MKQIQRWDKATIWDNMLRWTAAGWEAEIKRESHELKNSVKQLNLLLQRGLVPPVLNVIWLEEPNRFY